MSARPVSLNSFVQDLIAMPSKGATAYLNRLTGDVLVFAHDIIIDEDDVTGSPVAPDELRVESSPDYLLLPDKIEIDERHMIKRFCASVDDFFVRDRLLECFRGKGKFRRFKDTLDQFNLREDWRAFQEKEYKRFAIGWLEQHNVPYVDDMD